METISSNRRNGKKQELLKKIGEMLHKKEIVLAFNSKQLQERDRQIRKKVCSEICDEIYTQMIVYGKELRYSDLNLILGKIEKGE